jgi:hypothetical protein
MPTLVNTRVELAAIGKVPEPPNEVIEAWTRAVPGWNVAVNYGGRAMAFSSDPTESIAELRDEAIRCFDVVADVDQLGLYLANRELDADSLVAERGASREMLLVLRTAQGAA